MSKTTEKVLLVPGESGWEIWTRQGDGGFTLHSATGIHRAGDLTGLPGRRSDDAFPGEIAHRRADARHQ